MSTDVHETWAELERVRRDIMTLEHSLGPRFVSLYAQLTQAREQEAELLKQLSAAHG